VQSLALEVEGREDVVISLESPDDIMRLKTETLTIKEGITYRLKVAFRVQHEVISGLKYLHVVKKMGMKGMPLSSTPIALTVD
jgi:Rho GDP-dissociation inhibitor